MSERIRLEVSSRRDEIERLREMHKTAERAYLETRDEWDLALEQSRLWHKYEQALLAQRNAMNTAVVNLWSAIKTLAEIESMREQGGTQ